ncbi:hypothetical protein [Flaviflexus sp.]|uniref:hypothetical protein n=1 Tax=Flaviflexus sp. TaxID=1969482 RepID=UPI003F931850
MITIAQIALSSSPAPSRAMKEFTRVLEQSALLVEGDTESVSTTEIRTLRYRNQFSRRSICLLAIDSGLGQRMESNYGLPLLAGSADGVARWDKDSDQPVSITPEQPWPGTVIGAAELSIPLKENLDSAYVFLHALPGHEDALAHLWETAQNIFRTEKRSKISSYVDHKFGTDHRAPSSDVSLASTTISDFLISAGFELTQTEICSRLSLPADETVLAPLREAAIAKSGDYRLLSWTGGTPQEYREDMVEMMTAFEMDMPVAGIVEAEANYSVERLIKSEEMMATLGTTSIITAAQHIPTGHLAGYTQLDFEPGKHSVIQEDTLVLKEHRGNRLGYLIKIDNLERLREQAPERTFIQTWNAGENEWIWGINEQMGFRPHTAVGLWQRKI